MSSNESTCFVHDRLFHYWWAWIVLSQLLLKYWDKNSKIYVLFSPLDTFDNRQVVTALPSRINNTIASSQKSQSRIIRRLFDYRNLMPFYPVLVRLLRQKIKKSWATRTIISSFAAVKNISHSSIPWEKILYLHSPMQYIRQNYDEYRTKLTGFKKNVFILITWYLRRRDKKERPYDMIIANSTYTAQCAQDIYWRKESIITYPSLPEIYKKSSPLGVPHDYYLYIWRLVNFVRETDTIIDLCNQLSLPLVVVGTWPDEEELKQLAGSTITFLWLITDEKKKIQLLTQSKWLINLAKESLWIVTMEALSVWTPVLWYNQWWTKELVNSKNQWILVENKEFSTLEKAVQKFISTEYDREKIKKEFFKHYDSVGSII